MPALIAEREYAVIDRRSRREEESTISLPLPDNNLKTIAPDCLTYSPADLRAYINLQKSFSEVDLRNFSIFNNMREAGLPLLTSQLEDQAYQISRTHRDQLLGAGYIACGVLVDLNPDLEWKDAACKLPNVKQLFPEGTDLSKVMPELAEMLGLLTEFAAYKLFKSNNAGQLNAVIDLCSQISMECPSAELLVRKTIQDVSTHAEKAIILLSEDLKYKPNYQFAPHFFLELKEHLDLVVARCQPPVEKDKIVQLATFNQETFTRVG